jgi:hypothetical protein
VFSSGIGATTGAKEKGTSRHITAAYAQCKLAGVTGLEPEAFCDFFKEFEWFFGHVHTGAHKKCSQIVPDCRRLARML